MGLISFLFDAAVLTSAAAGVRRAFGISVGDMLLARITVRPVGCVEGRGDRFFTRVLRRQNPRVRQGLSLYIGVGETLVSKLAAALNQAPRVDGAKNNNVSNNSDNDPNSTKRRD